MKTNRRRRPKSPFPTNWGTLDDSIWKIRRQYRRKRQKTGYKVVNGQLLSVNDVGVLLREAAERVARRRKLFYASNGPAITTKLARKRRMITFARRRRAMRMNGMDDMMEDMMENMIGEKARRNLLSRKIGMNRMDNMMDFPQFPRAVEYSQFNTRHQRLVIDTNSRADNNVLAIYNLTIGVNANNLKKIIEKLGKTKILELKIKDLLSGSSLGYATFENTTLKELQRVKDVFNGALVDGRTIKVDIFSTKMAALAY